jgi:hypothetical protein
MAPKLKFYITKEDDLKLNEAKLNETMKQFLKYLPAIDDVKEFSSSEFITLEMFVSMYIDDLDVQLDEDHVWPYEWPIDV